MEANVTEVKKNTAQDLAREIEHFFFEVQVLLEIISSLSGEDTYNWDRKGITNQQYAMGNLAEIIHDKMEIFFNEMWAKYVRNENN